MAIPKTDIKELEDEISDSTDPREIKVLQDKLLGLLKQRGQAAEGEMYAGKNNAAAMRETETVKAKMGQMKREVKLVDDFPTDPQAYSQILEDWRRETNAAKDTIPDNATLNAYWATARDTFSMPPSEVPRKKLDKTIPGGVKRLYEQGPRRGKS